MKTIKLEISDNIYNEVISLMTRFNSKDLKITDYYSEEKRYLQTQLERLERGVEELFDIEELDRILEETISKYEDTIN
ncbi:MAG: hypothetical protein CVV25_11805 [Ignavibacteriae bacterium HGW-Ignavibacteriae-4]|jgi:hypothetical protein|nr:MAG: hypothetical protein CVV25_11805 [Ignavibacteriae bacterium HGW-Ignavibacteriae-4]